jgi:trigger factor
LLKKLSKNEAVEINVRTAFSNDMELIIHSILKTDHNTAGQMNERFRFTLLNITHIDKAALNQQLFDLAFGKAEINSEDELRSRVKSDLENEYLKYTSSKLDRAIQEYLLNHTNMSLPVEFLRKLINSNKEGAEDITEQQMNQHMNQVKWDLIHDRMVRENELSVAREELIDYTKLDILNYYKNEMSEDEEALSRLVNSLLNDDKVFELLKSKISIEEKAVDLHEFYHH